MTNELEKMNKRREVMEDGRRYIVFYTFEKEHSEKSNRKDTERRKEKVKSDE